MAERLNPKGEQLPSVGRVVHYCDDELRTLAAIVTEVAEEGGTTVRLTVFHPRRTAWALDVPVVYSAEAKPDTWRWPPRV